MEAVADVDFRLKLGNLNIDWTSKALGEQAVQAYPLPSSGGDMPDYPDALMFQLFGLNAVQLNGPDVARRVAIVKRCALLIANDIASLPFVWEKGSGDKWETIKRKTGNVVDVWEAANPVDTAFEMVRDLVANWRTTGNGYLVMESFRTGKPPDELWVAKSHLVEVMPGRRRAPAAFIYDRGGRRERIEPGQMVHLRSWNPSEEPTGASDLEGVDVQYTARHELNQLVLAFMRSGGMGGGFFRAEVPSGVTAAPMDETQRKELEAKLNRSSEGAKDWYRKRVLPLLKWERQSMTPKELGISELKADLDSDVCMAMGVPPWMVGIKSGSGGDIGATKSGSETDTTNYIQRTLLPDVNLLQSVLTEKLAPRFGPNIRCRIDTSGMPALVAQRVNLGTQLVQLAGGPILSVNTARKYVGEEPDADPSNDEIREPGGGLAGAFDAPAPDAKPTTTKEPDTQTAPPEAKARRSGETPERARKRHKVRLAQYERAFARMFDRRVFTPQQERTIDALRVEHGRVRNKGQRIDLDRILALDYEDEAAIRDILDELVMLRGEEAAAQIAVELDVALHKARAVSFVQAQAATLVSRTTATTKDALRATLAEGELENETFSELVARVRDVFDERRANAVTIARTETVRAYNYAAKSAWADVPEVIGSRWLTAGDDVVREAHANIANELALTGEPFLMQNPDTGEMAALEYPGDPSAPAWATINCRCALDPEIDPDAVRAKRMADWWRSGTNGNGKPKNRIAELVK